MVRQLLGEADRFVVVDVETTGVYNTDWVVEGGFNRSSQHLDLRSRDGEASWMDAGADREAAAAVAGPAAGVAA